ncbi:MAG: phage tail protein [Clostridiales bacterium]|nr:phage tail protein [Clostridiales bacterium]
MAAEFNAGVLTTKGLALLAKWQAGECTPTITRAVCGSGSYSSGESLVSRTKLKTQKLSVEISKKTVQNTSTLLLRFIFSNETLTTGFKVTEVGIYATDPDDGEILYSIATSADEENADYLSAYNGTYPSTIVFNYQIEVANADSVTIASSGGAYAPADEFYELQANVEALQEQADGNSLVTQIVVQRVMQLIDQEHETGTVTLTNSRDFPLFSSSVISPTTVSLDSLRENTTYMVNTQVLEYEGGQPGTVEITDRLINGFKIACTGSATSVTIAYEVVGGMNKS